MEEFWLTVWEKGIPSGKKEKKKVQTWLKKKLVMHEQLNMTNEIGGVLPLTSHHH